jgi:hypothetical protein
MQYAIYLHGVKVFHVNNTSFSRFIWIKNYKNLLWEFHFPLPSPAYPITWVTTKKMIHTQIHFKYRWSHWERCIFIQGIQNFGFDLTNGVTIQNFTLNLLIKVILNHMKRLLKKVTHFIPEAQKISKKM